MSFIDCEHEYDFVCSSSGVGEGMHSHEVHICKKCGQFLVQTRKGGVFVNFTFNLMIPEQVVAAGQYVEYLVANGVTFTPDTPQKINQIGVKAIHNQNSCPNCGVSFYKKYVPTIGLREEPNLFMGGAESIRIPVKKCYSCKTLITDDLGTWRVFHNQSENFPTPTRKKL